MIIRGYAVSDPFGSRAMPIRSSCLAPCLLSSVLKARSTRPENSVTFDFLFPCTITCKCSPLGGIVGDGVCNPPRDPYPRVWIIASRPHERERSVPPISLHSSENNRVQRIETQRCHKSPPLPPTTTAPWNPIDRNSARGAWVVDKFPENQRNSLPSSQLQCRRRWVLVLRWGMAQRAKEAVYGDHPSSGMTSRLASPPLHSTHPSRWLSILLRSL